MVEGFTPIDEEEFKGNSAALHTGQDTHPFSDSQDSTPAGFFITQEQRKMAEIFGGGHLMESKIFSLSGFRIVDNPSDREVFIVCPRCKLDVFDSGLSNEIT